MLREKHRLVALGSKPATQARAPTGSHQQPCTLGRCPAEPHQSGRVRGSSRWSTFSSVKKKHSLLPRTVWISWWEQHHSDIEGFRVRFLAREHTWVVSLIPNLGACGAPLRREWEATNQCPSLLPLALSQSSGKVSSGDDKNNKQTNKTAPSKQPSSLLVSP